jgi:hypothetical protein
MSVELCQECHYWVCYVNDDEVDVWGTWHCVPCWGVCLLRGCLADSSATCERWLKCGDKENEEPIKLSPERRVCDDCEGSGCTYCSGTGSKYFVTPEMRDDSYEPQIIEN